MTSIEFTKDEATALLQLLDIAVKSGGLNVAGVVTALARKIAPAAQTQPDIAPKE